MFGYWRAWALGRHFRFLRLAKPFQALPSLSAAVSSHLRLLPDALSNRVFNGQEAVRIEDFCCQQRESPSESPNHAMSLLRLYSAKTKQPMWCYLYLRHVWLQDMQSHAPLLHARAI